jgi:hypothetical protein
MRKLYSLFSVSFIFPALLAFSAAAREPLSPTVLVREALERNPELNFYAAGSPPRKAG